MNEEDFRFLRDYLVEALTYRMGAHYVRSRPPTKISDGQHNAWNGGIEFKMADGKEQVLFLTATRTED